MTDVTVLNSSVVVNPINETIINYDSFVITVQLEIYCIIFTSLSLILVAYLTWYYKFKDTSKYVTALTCLCWLFSCFICMLVPIDLVEGNTYTMTVIWCICYWFTFAISWIGLPFYTSYYSNGGFTVKQKVIYSLKTNTIYVIVGGSIFIIGLIYLIAVQHWHISDIAGLLMCMSQVFGMCVLVILIGYGLIIVPYNIWMYSNIQSQIQRLEIESVNVHNYVSDSHDECTDTLVYINNIQQTMLALRLDTHIELCQRMMTIQNVMKHAPLVISSSTYRLGGNYLIHLEKDISQATLSQWTDIHNHCIRVSNKVICSEIEWKSLVYRVGQLKNKLAPQKWMSYYVHSIGLKVISILCMLMSICTLVDEISFVANTNKSLLRDVVDWMSNDTTFLQLYAIIPLMYFALCTWYPIFEFRWRPYYMMHAHSSDNGSLLYNSNWCLRVSVPLMYHFVMILHVSSTDIQEFTGSTNIIPFFGSTSSTSFNQIIPSVIFIVSTLTFIYLFRLYIYAGLHKCGFHVPVSNEIDIINEGRELIQQYGVNITNTT
jgi:hypothetical protein